MIPLITFLTCEINEQNHPGAFLIIETPSLSGCVDFLSRTSRAHAAPFTWRKGGKTCAWIDVTALFGSCCQLIYTKPGFIKGKSSPLPRCDDELKKGHFRTNQRSIQASNLSLAITSTRWEEKSVRTGKTCNDFCPECSPVICGLKVSKSQSSAFVYILHIGQY